MKKQMLTCDMCGTIIEGPGVEPAIYHADGNVHAGFPYPRGVKRMYSLDLCEDDWPIDLFGGEITLLFDGKTVEGELIDLQSKDVFAVLVDDRDEHAVITYTMDDLSGDQKRYVKRAVSGVRNAWKQEMEQSPRWNRNL